MNTLKGLFTNKSTNLHLLSERKQNKQDSLGSNPQFEHFSEKKSMSFYNKENTPRITPEILKELLLSQIKNEFQENFPFFYKTLINWMDSQWKKMRMFIQSRLTKLTYLQSSLLFQTYQNIQKEILMEWRKNNLLSGLTSLWIFCLKKYPFRNGKEIQKYISAFRSIFVILSMFLYRDSLNMSASKGVQVKLKLRMQSFIQLITGHKEWDSIARKIIEEHLDDKVEKRFEHFDFRQIEINPKILNVERIQDLFAETKASLAKLEKTYKVKEFTAILSQFRCNLLKELEASIEIESLESVDTRKPLTVEKQDVINSVIWILVRNKMSWIGGILNYFEMLLGSDIDKVLRWSSVDCFRIDIVAAYWFITKEQQKDQKQQ